MLKKTNTFYFRGLQGNLAYTFSLSKAQNLINETTKWGLRVSEGVGRLHNLPEFFKNENKDVMKLYSPLDDLGERHLQIFQEAQRIEFVFEPDKTDKGKIWLIIKYFKKGCKRNMYNSILFLILDNGAIKSAESSFVSFRS